MFSQKTIDLHLFQLPKSSQSLSRTSLDGSAGVMVTIPPTLQSLPIPNLAYVSAGDWARQTSAPRWEGTFPVDFKMIRWQGLADGAEKVDILVPLACKALGASAILRLSGA